MSFFDKFSEVIGSAAEKVDSNKYLSTIKNTFTFYMPIVIIGSFATLGDQLISDTETGLASFQPFEFLEVLEPAFSAMNFATISTMTLTIVFVFAYLLTKKNEQDPIFGAITALICYISVVPQSVTVIVEDIEESVSGLPTATIDASGLFIGMLLTVCVVEIFCWLCSKEKLKIKMPSSVPAAISKSFSTMIPIAITLLVVAISGRLFEMGTGVYINEFVYDVMQAPVEVFFQTPGGIIFVTIFMQLFWLVGIHGGLVISPVRNPILISGLAANIAAYEAGQTPTNAVTFSAWRAFMVVGGAGLVLSLIIAIFIASKVEEHRQIAKLSSVPAIFAISEPMVFGLPLVLNPVFAIPFVLASGLGTAIYMLAVRIGFILPAIVEIPFGLPLFVSGFIGFGWRGVVLQAIIIGAGVLLYLPFVLIANRNQEVI